MSFLGRFFRAGRDRPRQPETGAAFRLDLALALEPRIMLDAAAAATTAEAADGAAEQAVEAADAAAAEAEAKAKEDAEALAKAAEMVPAAAGEPGDEEAVPEAPAPTERQVVFVDHRVKDPEVLLQDLDGDLQVVMLDGESDGLSQIAAALDGMIEVDAVHIIAEGNDGEIYLGDARVTTESLGQYAEALGQIGAALSAGGDVLFYGCNLGETARGLAFIDQVAELTGADIAASDDRTASTALGGDADLEIRTGSVEAGAVLTTAALAGYQHSLATITVDVSNDTGAGGTSLREAIAAASAGDTITFASGLAGSTITLTAGELTISQQLTIDGDINDDGAFSAANDITISGGNSSRVFNVTGGASGSEVVLFGLRIQNGRVTGSAGANGASGGNGDDGAAGEGGGIRNSGHLIVDQAVIAANTVIGGAGGTGIGAIYNASAATFRHDSTLTYGSGGSANTGSGGTAGTGGSGAGGDGGSGGDSGTGTSGAADGTAGSAGSSTADVQSNGGATVSSSFSLPSTTNLNGDSFTFTEGNGATAIDQGGDATVADADSANFDGGSLTVTIVAGEDAAEDLLNFDTSGTVSLAGTTAGSNVSVSGTVVGTLGNAIAAGNDLVVNLNANSTLANVQSLVRAITYQNTDTNNPTTGDRTVRVSIRDGDGGISSNADVTVTVAAQNDAPTTTNLNGDSFTFTEGNSATAIDQGSNATVADVDSTNFSGGNVTVTIASGEDAAEDVLSLDTSGTVALAGTTAGSNVSVGGTVVGTLGNAIAAGNDLVVNLNASATPANVQTLVRAITYQNTDTDNPTTGDRTVRVTINDGDGGTSSNADVTVTVAGRNDAPSFTAGATLAAVNEDTADPSGATITSLLSGNFSDVDGNSLAGIVVTADAANGTTEGSWQYSTDGGSNWFDIGTVSTSSGLLLGASANDRVRFVPVSNYNGTPGSLTAFAVDNSSATTFTSGGTRQTFDTTADGATSTVSAAGVSVGTSITAANDAPTTTNLNGDSFTFAEGDSATAIDQSGDAVVADADSADFDGGTLTVTIASGEDAAEDVLSFDTSGTVGLSGTAAGSTVTVGGTTVGTLANAVAAGNDLVVNLNASSTPANVQALVRAITYRNTDTDNPTTGDRTVRVTINDGDGGTSANADVTVTVAGVNDAPSFTAGVTMAAIDEDATAPDGATIASLLSGTFSDPADGDSLAGIVVTADDASSTTEGAWQYSTDGGSTWFDIGTVSTSSGLLLGATANDRLRFLPAEDYNGTPGGLTVFAVDDSATTSFTSGGSRQSFDTTADDATSAVSAAGVTVTISVTPAGEAGLNSDQQNAANNGGVGPSPTAGGIPDIGDGATTPVGDSSRQSVDAVRGNVPRGEASAVTGVQDAVNDSQSEAAGQTGDGRSAQTLNTVNDATSDARSQANGTIDLVGPARGPSTTADDLARFLGGLAPAAGAEEEDDAPASGEQAPPAGSDETAPADVAPAAGAPPPQGGPAGEGEGEAAPEGDGSPDGGPAPDGETPPPDQPAAGQESGIILPEERPASAAGLSVQMHAVLASFERERQALVDAVSAGS